MTVTEGEGEAVEERKREAEFHLAKPERKPGGNFSYLFGEQLKEYYNTREVVIYARREFDMANKIPPCWSGAGGA